MTGDVEDDGVDLKGEKAIEKGGRLKFYPKYMQFYRTSENISKPETFETSYSYLKEMYPNAEVIYQKEHTIERVLSDDIKLKSEFMRI